MSDHENYYSSDDDSSVFDDEPNDIPITILNNNNLYPLRNTWVMYDHTKSDSETYHYHFLLFFLMLHSQTMSIIKFILLVSLL